MNEISDFQKKRAVNLIWNAARDYQLTPDFKAYDQNGFADLYWNCIIGAVYRHYDYSQLRKLFLMFSKHEDADIYNSLLWLGLENGVWQKEAEDRPVLRQLREKYARQYVALHRTPYWNELPLYDRMALAHYMRVLGEEPSLNAYDRKLLDELEFSPAMDTEDIVARASELFARWFQLHTEERKRESRGLHLSFKPRGRQKGKLRYRKFGLGFLEHPDPAHIADDGPKDEKQLRTSMTVEELRAFMSAKYGMPLFRDQQLMDIERQLCRGSHANCHLHFTKGQAVAGRIQNGFEALQREQEQAQIQKNRRAYQTELARNRTAIARLTEKIQNSVLLHLQPAPVKANSGTVNGRLVWRALELDDDRVFTRNEQGNMGDLGVDILLDASTSQKKRQEIVSCQGYMIAEALTRCAIPCRVMSFCSMTGFTILRIFRDYGENHANTKIFEYVSNGCNRDGLAIRAAHHLINEAPYEHKLLIVLSDVKPNDIIRIPPKGEGESVPYEKDAGITDTAIEVRRARADGIAVVCVFTGEEEDLPAAKLVYGRDFARIQSLDKLADTVGMLIQNQIRNL